VCGGVVTFLNKLFSGYKRRKAGRSTEPGFFVCTIDEFMRCQNSEAKVGCYTGDIFVGALAYADDVVLTAPSANALAYGKCWPYAMRMLLIIL